MQTEDLNQSRPSMMSVPARWRELYFNVFSALCVLGEIFLVWYEFYQRDSESDYLDIIMDILMNAGPVAMTAAIFAFIILKGRDAMLSTWETFARKRYEKGIEKGIEKGREEGREEREALARQLEDMVKRVAELERERG